MKKLIYVVILLLLLSGISFATNITFQTGDGKGSYSSTYDAFTIVETGGYPSSTFLRIGNYEGVKRAMLSFPNFIGSNANQVPYGVKVTSAKLKIKQSGIAYYNTNNTTTISIYPLLENWSEGGTDGYYAYPGYYHRLDGIMWTNTHAGPPTSSSATASDTENVIRGYNNWTEFDITEEVQNWVTYIATNRGFLIKSDIEATSENHKEFYSSNDSTSSNRPLLDITYTAVDAGDTTPPTFSNEAPTGAQASNTTSVSLTVDTSEAAVCKYSTSSGVTYINMTSVFTTTGSTTHSSTISGLSAGNSYTYYVRCIDYNTNMNTSDKSIAFSVTADSTGPSQVTDLAVDSCDSDSCTLSWTEVGDDATTGDAASIDIRYSTAEITALNWSSSTQYIEETTPLSPGETETYVVAGLAPNTTYYFAVKVKDDVGNIGTLSNIPNDATDAVVANTAIDAWFVDVSEKIRPTTTKGTGTSKSYSLAKNEWGAYQFVVTVDKERIDNATVTTSMSDFDNITIFYEGNIQIITPSSADGDTGEYPDVMYPKVDSYYSETRNTFPLSLSNVSRAYPFMTGAGYYSYGEGRGDGPSPCGEAEGCWEMDVDPASGYIYPYDGTQSTNAYVSNHNLGDGDVASGGTYYGTGNKRYYIVIEETGALNSTTFKWSEDNGATWQTGIPVTDSATTIDSGITVTFSGEEDADDFTEDDEWIIYAGETYNHVFWVDYKAPDDATADTYSGTITITADDKDNEVLSTSTKVWNFNIPSTSSLKNYYGNATIDYSRGHTGLTYESGINQVYIAAGLNHKISLGDSSYTTGGGAPSCSCVSYNEGTEELEISCTQFDTYVGPFLDGTGTAPAPEAVSFEGEMTTFSEHNFAIYPGSCSYTDTEKWEKNMRREFYEHLETNGWEDKFYVYIVDEPANTTAAWDGISAKADEWHSADADIKGFVTSTICNAETYGDETKVDVFVQEAAFSELPYDTNKYSEILGYACRTNEYDAWLVEDATREVWNYHTCIGSGSCAWPGGFYYTGWPNYGIDQDSLVSSRMRTWFDRKFNYTGELYYSVNYGHYRFNSMNIDPFDSTFWFAVNGDGILFYPGMPSRIGGTKDIPLESLRLKIIRLSFQDYEYFKLLDDASKSALVDSNINSIMSTAKDFVDSPSLVEDIREVLGDELSGETENIVPEIQFTGGCTLKGFTHGN